MERLREAGLVDSKGLWAFTPGEGDVHGVGAPTEIHTTAPA